MMRTVIAIILVLAGVYGFGWTQSAEIQTEIEIDVSPDEVWDVLTDFAAYPDWNPFIQKIEGIASVDETLTVEIHPLHMEGAQTFAPVVLVADPAKELRWLGQFLAPGLFDGEHYFQIEATETGARLVHGERFRGLLLLVFNVQDFKPSFDAMNTALKRKLEEAG